MFVSFDVLAFLFWAFISSFIPGAILSFSIFKKDEDLLNIEKLFIGFALGMIILPLIPFILYLVLGIKYSYSIALLSVAVLYAVALAFFVKNKAYEGISLPSFDTSKFTLSKNTVVLLALVVILFLSYIVRIGSYSPIFQELDPYFYTYTAQQLLTVGENPIDDQTAWFPEVSVNHRLIPEISYLESIWYSLYTGGGAYDNLLLALIASMYPPLAAVLAVFFIYLFVSLSGKREWGVIAAGLASFTPVLVYKLSAGEQEVQPYAFFALAFFYAMYAFSIKRKDIRFAVLAGLGFAAVSLGSSSQILALSALMIFVVLQSILVFIRDEEEKGLFNLIVPTSIVFIIGPLLGSAILRDIFLNGSPGMSVAVPILLCLVFAAVLYILKQKLPNRDSAITALGVILILGIIVYAVTPLGDLVKQIAEAGFGIVRYNSPLDRTIAEQGLAPSEFGGQIGFIAETYPSVASLVLWPVRSLLISTDPTLSDSITNLFTTLLSLIFLPFSLVTNVILNLSVGLINVSLGTSVELGSKANSLLLLWIFIFFAATVYSLWRFTKNEDNLFVLFLAAVLPPVIVGLIKAKYTIYAGVMIAIAIGFSLEPLLAILSWLYAGSKHSKKTEHKTEHNIDKKIYSWLLIVGALLVFLQFIYNGFSVSLAWGSIQTLYQDNPTALSAKFQQICSATGDSDVCAAAADPLGYANLGTNFQYNGKLCMLSIFSNYAYIQNPGLAPSWEAQTAFFRCQRIADYWIDSMEWIKNNTEPGTRITSWWDYGHWINFFGQRNAVLRNEHASRNMIGAVADGYLDAKPEELKAWMKEHDSKYALFDMELIAGGGALGGKYGALNYLSCAWNNETTVLKGTGESQCEADHLWETVFVSSSPCTISKLTNRTGFTAYKIYAGPQYLPYYPSFCINPTDQNAVATCQNAIKAVPVYCVAQTTLVTGQETFATYYLNETYPNGDLKINKAIIQLPYQLPTTYHLGPVTSVTLFYSDEPIWLENGEIKSGYEDRKGKFYDSNLYRAIFTGSLPGFKLVYTSPGGAVKIYQIEE